MSLAPLSDRAIVAVSGADAEALLNRLVTRSTTAMAPSECRYAALLSPQGKLLFDFLIYRRPAGFWLDVPAEQAAELARKLTLFRLRAAVTIAVEPELAVAASWGSVLMEAPGPAFRDPRHDQLGYRIVASPAALPKLNDAEDYEVHRVALGIPRGGTDWVYGDTFVHDANLDLLQGVDFDKGCYVGQEVVSRVHHRQSARKRIVKLRFFGDAPEPDTPLTAAGVSVGSVTTVQGRIGLAMARIDRLAEAAASKAPVVAGDTLVDVTLPTAAPATPADYAATLL